MTWVCVLAGISSQNHHLGVCVRERERDLVREKGRGGEKRESSHVHRSSTWQISADFLGHHVSKICPLLYILRMKLYNET